MSLSEFAPIGNVSSVRYWEDYHIPVEESISKIHAPSMMPLQNSDVFYMSKVVIFKKENSRFIVLSYAATLKTKDTFSTIFNKECRGAAASYVEERGRIELFLHQKMGHILNGSVIILQNPQKKDSYFLTGHSVVTFSPNDDYLSMCQQIQTVFEEALKLPPPPEKPAEPQGALQLRGGSGKQVSREGQNKEQQEKQRAGKGGCCVIS